MKTLRMYGQSREQITQEAARVGLRLSIDEWNAILERLNRDPTLAEAFFFDVSWSEHCSYKSSRTLLKEYLPPLPEHVLLGPGEDAGVVSLGVWNGEEWTLVLAHESHNHPSQVLPVEGAATGIGGVVRDVYCMGADVIGVLDPLRFGDPDGPNAESVRAILRGVVQGIAEYGNALGVPNLGGEVAFHPGFDENCLVNVVAFGVAPRRRILRSRVPELARTRPYVLVLVGKPTDATGLGGASFASQLLDEAEAIENRGAVQIHDPFLKRVLVEGMKEAWEWLEQSGLEVGCKDLGAGGLAGASSELVFAADFGAEIDLDQVPRGVPGLLPHEVLCAETQERFVWAIPEEHAEEFCAIWNDRYELGRIYPEAAARVVGRVLSEPVYRCSAGGAPVLDLKKQWIEETPRLSRPRAERAAPAMSADPERPSDWVAWAISEWTKREAQSRAAVYRYFDPEVQGRAFFRPGEAGAGVCRPIPGTELGLSISVDGNPDYGALDAYWGGALAVLESASNVVATGARPFALTDCLNFGNPEDPVCLGDLERALRGMRDASRALGCPGRTDAPLPFVSGNVSLYNQSTSGRAIPPSPIVACFGTLADYGRALSPRWKEAGSLLFVTGSRERAWGSPRGRGELPRGRVPMPDLAKSALEIRSVLQLIEAGRIRSAEDIADGGLLRALFTMAVREEAPGALGAEIDLDRFGNALPPHELLLSESPGFVLEVATSEHAAVEERLRSRAVVYAVIGTVTARPSLAVRAGGRSLFDIEFAAAYSNWAHGLEAVLFECGGER